MIRMALKPLVAACLLASLSTAPQAAPSPYSTLVVFGDSLSDAGQFPDPAGPAGSTSRFTNRVGPTYQNGSGEIFGPTAPMLLGNQLGIAPGDLAASTSPVNAQQGIADGNNWAVGGYRTDQIYDSITAANGSLIERDNTLLRSRDGYLVDRARQGLGADPNALYYITGGGNDFLQGRILNDVQAQQAAGRLVDSVQALQQAGARYIVVWLLPDLGLTPATFGGPLQPFASQLSGTFNAELTAQLSQAGANVIPLNIPLLLKEGMANPASFGLAADQNLIGTCFSGNGCTMNPTYGINGSTPDPSKLLFNDSVHPTITGQRLIADYTYSLLSAPWELTLLPEMAHGTLRAYQDELRSQWQADWENWQNVGQWRGFVGGGGQHCQGRDSLAGLQADETPGGPRREVLEHQHLLWLEVRALRLVLPGKRLERQRQADLRVDPQRREERLTQVAGLALGSEAQGVRTRRVVADMRSGVGFLLVQQGGQSAALGGEERLQRLHLDFRRLADGRQLAQCQVAAYRMVGPGPQARRDDPRPQQQATQQQLHRLFALVSTRCRQAYQCGTPRALSCLDIRTLR